MGTNPPTSTEAAYRSHELRKCAKELRAAVRHIPGARLALERFEKRVRFELRVVEAWDDHHAAEAERCLQLGQVARANTMAGLIFDDERRVGLYERCPIGIDDSADEWMAEALELERQVLV
jgi:hypothetical protein